MTEPAEKLLDFSDLLTGAADSPQIVAFLTALNQRGITAGDLTALVKVMRAAALPFPPKPEAIDVCGTGGDGLDTPNISTAVALVVAGCGVPTVKHGNRAASSRSGSADVLEALGVNLAANTAAASMALEQANICFLFARAYHPAMQHVAAARKAIGARTIFNLAGPLANPAQPQRQLVGVYDRAWLIPVAEALRDLGSRHAWVVHSRDGMDELSTRAPSDVICLKDGVLNESVINPEDYGLPIPPPDALRGGDAQENAALIRALLADTPGPLHDIVCLNAGAALVIAERAPTLGEGIALARASIRNGKAANSLTQLIAATRQL